MIKTAAGVFFRKTAIVVGVAFVLGACKEIAPPLPNGTVDPRSVETAAGAQGMFEAARVQFQSALMTYVVSSGVFTDELSVNTALSPDGVMHALNARASNASAFGFFSGEAYGDWHAVRTYAMQALGALAEYDGQNSTARRGLLYAIMGYAELYLADFYCSGIPLSTFDYKKDFTYRPASKTEDVYRHAIALFDTATQLARDSIPVIQLAHMGTGRAYLAIGRYDSAAAAVRDVPNDFVFSERIYACSIEDSENKCRGSLGDGSGTVPVFAIASFRLPYFTVSDREGNVGLPYISSNDPRTTTVALGTGLEQRQIPAKYPMGQVSQFVVASGLEARLISAEADLHTASGGRWRETLNALRMNAGLDTLSDPGSDITRVDLLFRERAFWLFLTGQRQGDLRRLVRNYKRRQETVYPSGIYNRRGVYGTQVDLTIPTAEYHNPLFTGCISHD